MESAERPVQPAVRAPREISLHVVERDPELEEALRVSKLEHGKLSYLVYFLFF